MQKEYRMVRIVEKELLNTVSLLERAEKEKHMEAVLTYKIQKITLERILRKFEEELIHNVKLTKPNTTSIL